MSTTTPSGLASSLKFIWDKTAVMSPLFIGPILPSLSTPKANLSGKTVIVTGGNTGIGYGLTEQFAAQNAHVFIACRNATKASAARSDILKTQPNAKVDTLSIDTSTFASVKSFAAKWAETGLQIDILVHNAGIASLPDGKDGKKEKVSKDGLPLMYQTNFLSSFLLTQLLEPYLSARARVLFTSSMSAYNGTISPNFALTQASSAHEPGFHILPGSSPERAVDSEVYLQSKLMQMAFARSLQQRFDRTARAAGGTPEEGRLAFAWEPGLVATGLQGQVGKASFWDDPTYVMVAWCIAWFATSLEQGCATGLHAAVSEGELVKSGRGGFWTRNVMRLSPASFYDQAKLDRLWARWSADADTTWT